MSAAVQFSANGAHLEIRAAAVVYLLTQRGSTSAVRCGWQGHGYRTQKNGAVQVRPVARAVMDDFGQLVEVRP